MSTFTVRQRSSGKAIRGSDRLMKVPKVSLAAAKAARPGMPHSLPACVLGQVQSCGSTPRSIRVSVSPIPTGWPDISPARPTSSALPTLTVRVQRYFIRQTIDLGGAAEEVNSDINQFAGSQTANRLVLTVGRLFVVDIFETNKYANDPRGNFLNWSVINATSFDFAGDSWSSTYGAVAEWY
jgi:hypothetical protein